jgi:hypothetical protein
MVMGLPKILKSQTLLSVLIDYQDTLSRHTMTLHTHYDTSHTLRHFDTSECLDRLSRHTIKTHYAEMCTVYQDTPCRHTIQTHHADTIQTHYQDTIKTHYSHTIILTL